jgi:hypothetical protein
MRIDDLNRTPATEGAEQTDQAIERRPLEKNGIADADRAVVSDLAQALTVSDPCRLERLRLEVESGKYNPSADAVAKSVISAHLKE